MDKCERAYLIFDRPIPGIDHIKAFDPEELSSLIAETSTNFDAFNIKPLKSFAFAAKPQWFAAEKGLEVVRDLIALHQSFIEKGTDGRTRFTVEDFEADVSLLRKLQELLEQADVRDIRFHFRHRE